MNDRVLWLLLAYPQLFIVLGRALFGFAGFIAALGLRIDRVVRRIGRITERAGVEAPNVVDHLPWWLRVLIPETVAGWAVVVIAMCLGVYLAYMGKRAKNQR